jgi:hypothetical protein
MVVNEILTMKKQYIAACLTGIAALGLGTSAKATDTDPAVFLNAASASTTGNQSGFTLGMDFNVACPTIVSSLGTFDNNLFAADNPGGSGSIAGSLSQAYATSGELINIYVAIYNTATGAPVTPIVDFTTAGAGSYYAIGSSIYQTIAPVTLPVGPYAIEATGYFFEPPPVAGGVGGFQSGYDQGPGAGGTPSSPIPVFNTLGGFLTLSNATFSGVQQNAGQIALPANLNTPPQTGGVPPPETPATGPEFLAGTFQATCNCSTPDGGTTIALLGFALTGIAGLSRKFKK